MLDRRQFNRVMPFTLAATGAWSAVPPGKVRRPTPQRHGKLGRWADCRAFKGWPWTPNWCATPRWHPQATTRSAESCACPSRRSWS